MSSIPRLRLGHRRGHRDAGELDLRRALACGRGDPRQRAPHVEPLPGLIVVDLARLEIEVRVHRRLVVPGLELHQRRDRPIPVEAHGQRAPVREPRPVRLRGDRRARVLAVVDLDAELRPRQRDVAGGGLERDVGGEERAELIGRGRGRGRRAARLGAARLGAARLGGRHGRGAGLAAGADDEVASCQANRDDQHAAGETEQHGAVLRGTSLHGSSASALKHRLPSYHGMKQIQDFASAGPGRIAGVARS